MLSAYFAIAGVFAGWVMGYMASDPDPRTGWKVWASEISIAVAVGVFWPLAVIAVPVLIWLAKRRHTALAQGRPE